MVILSTKIKEMKNNKKIDVNIVRKVQQLIGRQKEILDIYDEILLDLKPEDTKISL